MLDVFIAEPNQTMRLGIKSFVQGAGYKIVGEAGSASEVVSELASRNVDLLLIEPKVGGVTGEGFIRELRALAPSTIILGISDLDELKCGPRMLRAGLRGFVRKSCQRHELITAVEQVSRGRPHISAALAEGLARGLSSQEDDLPHNRLSKRELDVFRRMLNGEKIGQIGEDLNLSHKTISTYKLRVFQKLGVSNMSEFIRYAVANDLLESSIARSVASSEQVCLSA